MAEQSDLDIAAVNHTIAVLRARADLAAAHLRLDDLTHRHLTVRQRRRHEHDRTTFTTAADQLAHHLAPGLHAAARADG